MKRMPAFSQPHRGYRHTIDSALETLLQLGIDPSRITISMGGRGWADRAVIGQEPRAGAELTPDVGIHLVIAGTGSFHDLPVGMWDRHASPEPGAREILGLFDDPVQKAGHWIRQGARLFDIRPDDLGACARWITLFGIEPDSWPSSALYPLAVLLANLHRMAGQREAVELALRLILDLPLEDIQRRPGRVSLRPTEASRFAERHGRLGVDLVLGDSMEAPARWIVRIGPTPLSRYFEFQQPREQAWLKALLDLTLPMYQEYEVAWTVLDATVPIRLGSPDGNGILGVNTWFGTKRKAATHG